MDDIRGYIATSTKPMVFLNTAKQLNGWRAGVAHRGDTKIGKKRTTKSTSFDRRILKPKQNGSSTTWTMMLCSGLPGGWIVGDAAIVSVAEQSKDSQR